MKLDVIYNKSCQRMDELPDECIDMGMTSPPYWGLRDYGEDVREIWGGNPDCEHKWIDHNRYVKITHWNTGGVYDPEQRKTVQEGTQKRAFCQKCGAWFGALGLEPTFQLYLDHMMIVCAEIKRVLKKTGSFWLNMGDTYGGSGCGKGDYREVTSISKPELYTDKPNPQLRLQAKCLLGIPWRLVLRLIDEQGWILRNAIIWHKPNAMPSSVKDRCSNSYEFLFHLVKAKKYYFDLDAIREAQKYPEDVIRRMRQDKEAGVKPFQKGSFVSRHIKKINYKTRDPERHINMCGKNPGDAWTIPTQPRPEAHFATFPDKLCIKPIIATCPAQVCKKCGKARVRITKREQIPRSDVYEGSKHKNKDKNYSHKRLQMMVKAGRAAGLPHDNPIPPAKTIGWTDCGCNAGWDSGVLLDPFAGRGTALIMVKKLGRHYVGYELKKEYADMAKTELEKIDPLFRRR